MTPRSKDSLRTEEFFSFEWDSLRPNVKRAFLLACGDQNGWDHDITDVLTMGDIEVGSELESFVDNLEINFPWASDIQDFLDLKDNKEGLAADEEDMEQVKELI